MSSVFGVELSPPMLEAICAQAEHAYPNEACGVILGGPGASPLARVAPLANVQDRYHARDPERFPRSARDAFRVDELERLRLLEAAEREGCVERVVYHSHADAGAYFSPEDRAMAVVEGGVELLPGVIHLVVSVRGGRRSDLAAFRYAADRRVFEEERLAVPGLRGEGPRLPDLEARGMEGGGEARPIRAVGRGLVLRRVTEGERGTIERLAEGRQLTVGAATAADVERLGRGVLSPLTGFLREKELESIGATGRLLSGTPWRVPITLETPRAAVEVEPGAVVELALEQGAVLGAMGVVEVTPVGKSRVRLAGPVHVYPALPGMARGGAAVSGLPADAAEMRAELLRRGASRVLAIPPGIAARRVGAADLSSFDAILAPEALAPSLRAQPLPLLDAGRGPWIDAAIAQNLGATHVWCEDTALASDLAESLAIAPWHP